MSVVPGRGAVLPEASVSSYGKKEEDAPAPAWAARLARHLLRIDEKLDRIIERIGCQCPDISGPRVVDTVNISGSGIGLVLTEAIDIGQVLEISVNLPGFPLGVFEAYGEVVRVTAKKGKDKGLFDVALKFLYINDEDREQLIACSFAAQRKVIRETNASD